MPKTDAHTQYLYRIIGNLKAELESLGIEPICEPPVWSEGLTAQETALLAVLVKFYPKLVSRDSLALALPRKDHAIEVDDKQVDVIISKIKRKFGSMIINVYGHGWKVADDWYRENVG